MWCPNCDSMQKCMVIVSRRAGHRHFYYKDAADVSAMRRTRFCYGCLSIFDSVELSEDTLRELKDARIERDRLQKRLDEITAVVNKANV